MKSRRTRAASHLHAVERPASLPEDCPDLETYVQQIVDAAPPLTDAQRRLLAMLLSADTASVWRTKR